MTSGVIDDLQFRFVMPPLVWKIVPATPELAGCPGQHGDRYVAIGGLATENSTV